MIKRIAWFSVVAALVSAWPASVAAFELPTGVHELHWVLPPARGKEAQRDMSQDASITFRQWGISFRRARPRFAVTGARSSKVLIAGSGSYPTSLVAVVDESKGTDSGYDSLYILPFDRASGSIIDITNSRRIALASKPIMTYETPPRDTGRVELTMLDAPKDVILDLPFGEGPNQVIEQVGIDDVDLRIDNGTDNALIELDEYNVRSMSKIRFRGKWTATVSTAEGTFTFVTVDGDGSGIFNDYARPGGPGFSNDYSGEYVSIVCEGKWGTTYQTMFAGRPMLVQGQFYVADINDVGNRVTIKRCDLSTGQVHIQAVDGSGGPAGIDWYQLTGLYGAQAAYKDEDLKALTGEYAFNSTLTFPAGSEHGHFGVSSTDKIKVEAGKATTISIGGSIHLIPSPDDKQIVFVEGACKSVELRPAFAKGDAHIEFAFSTKWANVTLTIQDPAGAVVWTGTPNKNYPGRAFSVDMPKTIKAGKYMLIASIAIPGYQDAVTSEKPVEVLPVTGCGPKAIPPGRYRMELVKKTRSDHPLQGARQWSDLNPMTPRDAARLAGARLDMPYWGVFGRFTIITDSRQSAAYLIMDAPAKGRIDLSKAAKLTAPASSATRSLVVDYYFDSPVIDTEFGSAEFQMPFGRSTREVGYELKVRCCRDTDESLRPIAAILQPTEFRRCTIHADSGDVTVTLVDGNANGLLNDTVAKAGLLADCLEFRSYFEQNGWSGDYKSQPLSAPVFYNGKYYDIQAAPNGDSIDIKPYTGPMGKLRISFRNLKGESIPTGYTRLTSAQSCIGANSPSDFMDIPAGSYDLTTNCYSLAPVKTPAGSLFADNWFSRSHVECLISHTSPVNITDGRTTDVDFGGPIKLDLEPGSDSVSARDGHYSQINISATMGPDKIAITRGITAKITDSSGKVWFDDFLLPAAIDSRPAMSPLYLLIVPPDVQPGQYTLTLSIDTGDDQGVVSAEKKMSVE